MLMHRFQYTKLTEEQIDKKLAAAKAGPGCAVEYPDYFAGKSIKIIADNGPVLDYIFKDKKLLTLAENNGNAVECGYGALTLKHAAIISHMIPGTQKGYNLIINLKTSLATVVEVWFSGYKSNREARREIYYGYIDTGEDAPAERHHTTNRLSGKGFHWITDRGIETLEFFPSVTYSSFVELTRQKGELTFCAPADYILIDENIFLYDRIECEFSGIMTMYICDMLSLNQAGVRLGFNEKDDLEYYMFTGKGKITGQATQFQRFNDHGKVIVKEMEGFPAPATPPPPPGKGERPVYRPLGDHPPMTEEEVHEAVSKSSAPFADAGIMDSGMGGNKMPLSGYLAGKELTVRFDRSGPVWNYKFTEMKKLQWKSEDEKDWHDEPYEAFEPDEDLVMFAHPHTGTRPHEGLIFALDFKTGLATCVNSKLGTEYMANEVSQDIIFGIIEAEGLEAPHYNRHHFTDDLLGMSYTWAYSDTMTSIHVYSTPNSYSWTIFYKNGVPGMMWSSPCRYVKLRDDVYLFTWVEEACNGSQGTFVFNKRLMHDCGYFYGVDRPGQRPGGGGLTFGSFGAFARYAGHYDINKYFGIK